MAEFVLEGCVLTMDPRRPVAEAVAVAGERIVAVGGAREVRASVGEAAESIALGDAAVLPGFIDAHHHYCLAAFDRRTPDLHHEPGTPIGALLERVAEIARAAPGDGWLRAAGYDPFKLAERRPPRMAELDEACPDRPLFLWAYSAHEACLNSAGFAAMGWDASTRDPPGGALVRDRRGRLTGEVVEAACFLADARSRESLLPSAADAWIAEVEAHGRDLLSKGITRVGDAGVPPSLERLYLRALDAGRLPLTVHRMPVGSLGLIEPRLDGAPTGSGPAGAPIGPAKLFVDGAERCAICFSIRQLVQATAATIRRAVVGGGGLAAIRAATQRAKFHRGPDGLLHAGILFWEQDALDDAVATAARAGLQVAQHAIGNEAIERALTAIERAAADLDRAPGRPRLEHAMLMDPALVRRAADAGAIAVVQPFFIHDMVGDVVGETPPPRPVETLPLRWMLDAGVVLAGSSDHPVSGYDVLAAVKAAATRRTRRGELAGREQAIAVDDALHAYTRGSAAALAVDDLVGTLTPGKRADLVVLSSDPTAADPERVDELSVLRTYVGGELAHDARWT